MIYFQEDAVVTNLTWAKWDENMPTASNFSFCAYAKLDKTRLAYETLISYGHRDNVDVFFYGNEYKHLLI